MSEARSRRVLRLAGWGLAAASLVFLAVVARRRWSEIDAIALGSRQWLAIAALALLYGLALFLLAAGWHCLLRFVGAVRVRPARSMHAYTVSQLAKYVPGNVFHLVGRHMMLRSQELPDRRLALAALLEAGLMLAAAGAVVLLAAAIAPPDAAAGLLEPLGRYRAAALVGALLFELALALLVALKLAGGRLAWAAGALAAYLLFFAAMGAMIVAILAMLVDASPFAVAGGGVAAWMAGFVTPGAPAGIGTREAAMLLFVGGGVPAGSLLVGAALFRLVTLSGDVLCFCAGSVLFGRH